MTAFFLHPMLIDTVALLSRLLVGSVFLIAALAKLNAPSSQFLNAILGYALLPKPMAIVLARGLPWLEVAAGGLLITGLWIHFATALSRSNDTESLLSSVLLVLDA
jgi:uncharacterized membrane protein YphA (DoxX/SURF4 family)